MATAPKKSTTSKKASPSSAAAEKKAAPAKKAATPKKAAPAAKKAAPAKKSATAEKKPAAPKAAAPVVKKEAASVEQPSKESFTAEEQKRLSKLQATMEFLSADPEWAAFLVEQKEALYVLYDEVAPNMQNTTRDQLRSGESNVSSSSGQHMGDAGSEAEARDLTIRLLDKDREQLFEIDAALERIRRGTYGICEESLEPIPKGRLRVRPFCRMTVKCQEEFEKKYGIAKSYRSSNSELFGYAGLQNLQENAISLDESPE